MIDWPHIKATLGQVISSLADLDTASVKWQDETGSAWAKDPVIYLRAANLDSEGIEEERRTDQGDRNQLVSMVGQRTFRLTVRAESFTQDISDPTFAGNLLEKIRIRLRRTTTLDQLAGIVAIGEIGGPAFFDYVDQSGRQVSCYTMDLTMRTVDIDRDTSITAGDFIGEAQIESAVMTSEGTFIPGPIGNTGASVNLDVTTEE